MTTIKPNKTESTTPEIKTDYQPATPQKEPPIACSSSVEITVPPLVNTVFAKSNEPRNVVVNTERIKASLESLERNRKLQKMGLG
jgi:hypothetical protein